MKILQISYTFPPRLTFGDGLTNVVLDISKELVRQGHEVSVYTSNSLNLSGTERIYTTEPRIVDGVTVHYLNYILKYRTFFITPSIISHLKKTITTFDIVHIQDPRSFQGVVAAHYARKYGVPYVWQPHGSFSHRKPKSPIARIIRHSLDYINKDAYIKSNRILVSNKTESEFLLKAFQISPKQITIVPNGINLRNYQTPAKNNFRTKLGLSDENIVLYLGRLHQSKGLSLLIKAFARQIKMRDENVVLVLAGPDDGYQQDGELLVDSLGLSDRVFFSGFLDQKTKLEALVDAKVFVTPSFTGFPITFLEACAMGLPIITTSASDELQWINGKVGYIVDPTSSSIALAIDNLISSDSLYHTFSNNAKQIVEERFTIERVVSNLVEIYRDIISM